MTSEEMIEKLRYKANNIKAHIEPEFFNEVADRLEEYKELEEQGLLVKLPCKISGWMYDTSINFNAVTPIRTDEVIIYELNNKYYYHYNCCNFDAHGDVYEEYEIDANDIGKTVFLTRAAAEEALEKIKEGGIVE